MKSKFLFALTVLMLMFAITSCGSNIKNAKTETVMIYGNCGMCEETIENAAFKENEAEADWDTDTKKATIIFDSKLTSMEEILKRIADAGYDNELFKANSESYDNLHECCKYERKAD